MYYWQKLSYNSLFLEDYRTPVGAQLLVLIMIVGT